MKLKDFILYVGILLMVYTFATINLKATVVSSVTLIFYYTIKGDDRK